ncbi:uncharacterized protein [Clytia hemisphaerica]|uniref:uncharacterized protein isoform X2 n=1 Tax=Clytia hemisphaerica TaxID=252671 RepID=UPI0034D4712E
MLEGNTIPALGIVHRILNEEKTDDKELLTLLYNLIISQQKQPTTDDSSRVNQQEFHNRLEEIISSNKLEDFNNSSIHLINKVNISNLLNYEVEIINRFLKWVYDRHYGWSEKLSNSDQSQESYTLNPSYEQSVILVLENILAWIENHDHLSYNLLQAFKYTIITSQSLPIVRKQAILSFSRWIKNLSNKYVIVVWKCFLLLKEIILLGLTDVWSAIRKDTASKLNTMIDLLDEGMIENLFLSLTKICDEDNSWQAIEGATRGIDKILSSCKVIHSAATKGKNDHPMKKIKLGRVHYDSLPRFMQDNLENVFFKLFAHQQLSVREVAGKAFSSFLYKSEYKYFIESFEKIICYLRTKFTRKNSDNHCHFMNAYEAEGFLNALLFLIKNIPLPHIAASWPEYWTVFSHYLMHNASTVRQTTSLLFKYILAKHQASLSFLKLVLQCLCASWKTDIKSLLEPIKTLKQNNAGKERPSVTNKKERHNLTACWEWREGRLLAYEVVLRYLITNNTYFMLSRSNFSGGGMGRNSVSSRDYLNKSINEGQLITNGLHKQNSFLQLDRHPFERRKLAKSLTLSNMRIPDQSLQKVTDAEHNQSLIQHAKKEKTDPQAEFLTEVLPQLKLTEIKGISKSQIDNNEEHVMNTPRDEKVIADWLNEQDYVPFRHLIKQMLLQTIESLEDQRWELRRMSLQLLSCLCDVIRCYDYSIMEDLYTVALEHADSALCYGACHCLLNNTKNFIKNQKVLTDSPAKYSEERLSLMKETNKAYERKAIWAIKTIATFLPNCQHRDTCNIVIQILLLYQLYGRYYCDEENCDDQIDGTICTYFQKLYLATQESPSVLKSPVKSSNKQMLDLLCEIQTHFLEYCQNTNPMYTVLLLPTLFQAIHLSMADSINTHLMLNCVDTILQKLKTSETANQNVLRIASTELCSVFEKDDTEAASLQQVVNIVLLLRDVMKSSFPLDTIKNSLRKRLQRAENDVKSKTAFADANTPRPMSNRKDKGSLSDDRLSFSTASFDSARCMTEDSESSESEDEKEKAGNEVDMDELSSDWDWSSGDEDERDESIVLDILGNLQEILNRTQPSPSNPPEIVLTEH